MCVCCLFTEPFGPDSQVARIMTALRGQSGFTTRITTSKAANGGEFKEYEVLDPSGSRADVSVVYVCGGDYSREEIRRLAKDTRSQPIWRTMWLADLDSLEAIGVKVGARHCKPI